MMPSAAPPVAVSPGDSPKKVHVTAVASVDVFLDWCRVAIDTCETFMEGLNPTVRTQICAHLSELAEKVKQGEHVKAMSEVSLEARKGGGRAMGDHLSPCRYGGRGDHLCNVPRH